MKFLRDIKGPIVIRIKFFKVLAKSNKNDLNLINFLKVITIQARWRLHFRTFNEKLTELKSLWDKGLNNYKEFNGYDSNEEQKHQILKEYLQQKMNIFYMEMHHYLRNVKNQNRAKTLALRFLSTAQRQDETSIEKEIRNVKKNSIFLFPTMTMEIKKSLQIKIKNKSSMFSTDNVKKIEEEKSLSSSNSLSDNSSDHTKQEDVCEEFQKKVSTLDETAVQRPILKYLPEDAELRVMIRKTLIKKKK